MKKKALVLAVFFMTVSLAGCMFKFQAGRRSDIEKIDELSQEIGYLRNVHQLLQQRLKEEIARKEVRLEMAERGLVITFLADILYDSGKAKLRSESFPILDKVARVLKENVSQYLIGIEGHTDNEPIRYSGWKSNWELSTARALSTLHYLVDKKGISPQRASAVGYGEYQPVASNDTKEGKQLNRRVEVVILPKMIKVKETKDLEEPATVLEGEEEIEIIELEEPVENIK
ncbi:MAG: OmpA family protein [Candidatus Omnitrophica bacterium]|nr:OmpA family protein [Candidatus Omnitrophota bacterium]